MLTTTEQSIHGDMFGKTDNTAATCVHSIFEKVAESGPDRVAIVRGNKTLTYSELNYWANAVAEAILTAGVERESVVAIAMERSPEYIACMLGVLKAGGAYLPLDPCSPRDRLAAMLEDADPPVVLTCESFADRFPIDGARVITIDELDLSRRNTENPILSIEPSDLAYVMYTSGSTGKPKGVMVEHSAVVRLVRDTHYADFGPDNVFLQYAPVTFDASTFEIWGALLNGGRLGMMPEGADGSLSELGDAIREYGVTTLWLTAGLFQVVIDECIDALKPLRQLLAGGDVLSATHIRKAVAALDCDLINGYGPTENTTFTCTYKIPKNVDPEGSIPIGMPIAGTEVIILDSELEPVGDGDIGELYIGGIGLARGYLNSKELTAERFVPNPFPHISSSRLYRSGDLARVRPDGNIEFLGRVDRQVKIRGYRIELEEVENAITRCTGVREAIVEAESGVSSEKRLVAFVVAEAGQGADISRLRARLGEILPDYMVPSRIVKLDAMPLTPNGKVDRAALLAMLPPGRGAVSVAEDIGRQELRIRSMLEDILGGGPLSIDENFFDLGATSLQLSRFHHRLRVAFNTDLQIVSLFQNSTIRSLAGFICGKAAPKAVPTKLSDRVARQRAVYADLRQLRGGGN